MVLTKEHGWKEHRLLPDLILKNLLGNPPYVCLPISFGKGGPQAFEDAMAIRQKEPGSLNEAVEQTPSPPNSHHQIQNKLYYTKPLKQWDHLLWRLTYGNSFKQLLNMDLRIVTHAHLQI